MPSRCIVNGCRCSYAGRRSFFNLPAHLNYKYAGQLSELSKKRRRLWLDALGLEEDGLPQGLVNICSKHFVKGKPALLEQCTDVDWVPSLHLNKPVTSKTIFEKIPSLSEDKRRKLSSITKYRKGIHHPKGELKKHQTNRVVFDKTIRTNLFNGTNGSGLIIMLKEGRFTAANITLQETAINNMVVRVPLVRLNLKGLKRKYKLRGDVSNAKRRKVSSFGRQIKAKLMFPESVHRNNNYSPNLDRVQDKNKNNLFKNNIRSTPVQAKEKNTVEIKPSINPSNANYGRSSDKNKTLNRVIKKNEKEKFKIKLFPKTSTQTSSNKNIKGGSTVQNRKPLELHREILFVKQYKNEHTLPSSGKSTEKCYYLKSPFNYCSHREGRRNYPFQKLVKDVKNMKLPAPSWKIKVVIRDNKISAITFTNKLELERCVGFSSTNDLYKVVIDNKPVLLLGSPNVVNCAGDIEILLDILENIDGQNPMILYK